MKRNPSQLRAIAHLSGPMMVLAGPGSGKTSVIVERTAYMINEGKIPASSILVVTFSRAAATEMKERFLKFVGQNRSEVTFGTFHGICYGILKAAYHLSAANILSEEEKFSILREMTEKYGQEMAQEGDFIEEVAREISVVKGNCISPEHYYASCCSDEIFRDIFHGYKQALKAKRKLDFDDMILCCYELFSQRQDILNAWRRKFVYILVDEFQDINSLQYKILQMLAAPVNNLFIVGDDDQSIYRFRGARPELMLHFKDDYPEAEQILLDTNYRSQKEIVEASLRLIGCNKERFQKKIQANQEAGEPVEYAVFKSQREEIAKIIWDIQAHMDRGGRYEDFAILFRTNTQPQMLMEKLLEYNIPFRMKDNVPNLYEHWIAKDIIAYMKIAMGSRYRKDFLKIMNRPKRYISRDSLDEETVAFDVWEWFYEDKPWVAERIQRLEYDIKMLSTMSPYAAINYIRRGIGYDEFCVEYADYRRMNVEDLYEVLEELQNSAKGFDTYNDWFEHIENYTAELEKIYRQQNQNPESVALATLHSSKGLEYDNVYIIDVNEGIMPYKKAVLDNEVEEERRMFYVGMTRAKKKLHLYSIEQLNHKNTDISRFIRESQKK